MIKIYGKIPKVKSDILNFKNLKEPIFATYKPKLEEIKKIAQNYKKFKNVIVIGNGGSINNFRAISKALDSNKKIFLADTMEPKILEDISRKCLKNDTVIISVSKSGNTIGVLEDLIYFINRGYKNFVSVTGGGALKEISKKMNFPIIDHPNISGRFSGMTSCALFPSAVCGFDIKKIYNGSKTIYSSKKIKSKTEKFLQKNISEIDLELIKIQKFARSESQKFISSQIERKKFLYAIMNDKHVKELLKDGKYKAIQTTIKKMVKDWK